MIGYCLFWLLLTYEIGKRLIHKYLYFHLVCEPNITLHIENNGMRLAIEVAGMILVPIILFLIRVRLGSETVGGGSSAWHLWNSINDEHLDIPWLKIFLSSRWSSINTRRTWVWNQRDGLNIRQHWYPGPHFWIGIKQRPHKGFTVARNYPVLYET